jgi:hypothetical protein
MRRGVTAPGRARPSEQTRDGEDHLADQRVHGDGPHRIIAVVADWRHIPLNPLVADTVKFTVK